MSSDNTQVVPRASQYVFKLHVVVVLIWITGSYIAVEARIVRSSVS